jgi:hypothetical protein
MNDSLARVVRTAVQLIAGGILTALTDQVVKDIDPVYVPYFVAGYSLLVTVCQNLVEEWKGRSVLRQSSPPAKPHADPVDEVN